MTFKEAVDFKSKLGKEQIIENGMTMKIFITPADHDDFTRYVTDFRVGRFTDETSIRYSLSGKFKVYGLHINGADVIYKDLTK